MVTCGLKNVRTRDVPTGLRDVVQVAAKGSYSSALTHDGRMVEWGRNEDGQYNVPKELCGVVKVVTMDYCSSPLISYGNWVYWGEIIVPARATPTNR